MKLCNFEVGLDQPFFLIAGPCIIEDESMVIDTAATLKEITTELNIPFIYKTSFDKANRTSHKSFRGVGLEKGMQILEKVKKIVGVPILTDVHEDSPLEEISKVADVLQTPAFLCRQTNFIQRVAKQNLPMNIKKGQFISPWQMKNVVEKARAVGNNKLLVCERGFSFGYNDLIVDMRSLAILRETNCPVVMDVTHAVQQPGGLGDKTGGQRKFVPLLARAAMAAGVSGLFMETHPNPDKAKSDGPNMWPLSEMKALLTTLKALDKVTKKINVAFFSDRY